MPVSKAQVYHCVILVLVSFSSVSHSATFTIKNNCPHTIWPGTLAGSGTPPLPTTGFRLDSGQSVRIPSVPGWSGRIWARTGCIFDAMGVGKCLTGDCGGRLECSGNGASPPASLFEITLGMGDDKDFYDVSIVDGYNLPLVAAPVGAFGPCNATGCVSDINTGCPKELQVVGGEEGVVVACKSACEAFGLDQYCCSGQFANPTTCRPSFYSALFKQACPRAYSYAFDDGTSTFTCKAYEYSIIFCPYDTGKRNSDGPLAPPSITSLPPPSIDPLTPPSIPSISSYTPPPNNPLAPPSIPPANPLTPPSIPWIGSFPPPPVNPLAPPLILPIDQSPPPPSIGSLTPPLIDPLTPPLVDPLTPPSIPIEDPRHGESVRMVSSSVTHLPLVKLTLLLIVTLISSDH